MLLDFFYDNSRSYGLWPQQIMYRFWLQKMFSITKGQLNFENPKNYPQLKILVIIYEHFYIIVMQHRHAYTMYYLVFFSISMYSAKLKQPSFTLSRVWEVL